MLDFSFLGVSSAQYWFIFKGAGWTIILSLIGFIGGSILGLPLALVLSRANKFIQLITKFFVKTIQGIPLPVMMFICYFGLSIAGFQMEALVAAGVAMTLYSSSFLCEIWRDCILSVPKPQWESADCLALTSFQKFFCVIFPQALRVSIPPTVGFMVQIIKNSSYAVVIGFFDLTYSARVVNNSTFEPMVVFSLAAIIYFILCYPLSKYSLKLEAKLSRYKS